MLVPLLFYFDNVLTSVSERNGRCFFIKRRLSLKKEKQGRDYKQNKKEERNGRWGHVFGSLLLPHPCPHIRGMKHYRRKYTISSKHWEVRTVNVHSSLCLWFHTCGFSRSVLYFGIIDVGPPVCLVFCFVEYFVSGGHEAKLLVLNIVSIKQVASLLHWMNHEFFTFMWTCIAGSPNVRFMWTFKKGNKLHKITVKEERLSIYAG